MEAVKKVLSFLFQGAKAYTVVTADGRKMKWTDLGMLGPVLFSLPEAVNSLKDAGKQWEDATPEQRQETIAYLTKEFDIADDKLEAKIEAALSAIVKSGGLYKEVVELIADVKIVFKKDSAPAIAAPVAVEG